MRGWILEHPSKNTPVFYCHNCSRSMSLSNFIKEVSPAIHIDYIREHSLEKYRGKDVTKTPEKKQQDISKIKKKPVILEGLQSIGSLNIGHPVKKYVTSRGIPSNKHYRLYYAKDFNNWVNKTLPDKLNSKIKDKRLVIPFYDKKGEIFGVSGRSLDPNSKLRYITIMFDESKPKIFGLDEVDCTEKYYIVEGPIDSLFIDNSIAMVSADFDRNDIQHKRNAVIVYDNEPRNAEIVKKIEKVIDEGFSVVIWPSQPDKKEDINDMVLQGIDVMSVIKKNTYKGLLAKLQFSKWRLN